MFMSELAAEKKPFWRWYDKRYYGKQLSKRKIDKWNFLAILHRIYIYHLYWWEVIKIKDFLLGTLKVMLSCYIFAIIISWPIDLVLVLWRVIYVSKVSYNHDKFSLQSEPVSFRWKSSKDWKPPQKNCKIYIQTIVFFFALKVLLLIKQNFY